MGFQDLPDDWPDQPLTDPQLLADVLDLVVMERDRRAGGLAVLICDGHRRLAVPVMISEPDDLASDEDRRNGLEAIAMAVRSFDLGDDGGTGRPGIHLAIARRDGLSVTGSDRAWQRAAAVVCADDIDLLGVHIVTSDGSRTLPPPEHRPAGQARGAAASEADGHDVDGHEAVGHEADGHDADEAGAERSGIPDDPPLADAS